MKAIRLFMMLVLFSSVFGTIDALAGNVYGTSAVIYDYANNRTRGYHRTQLDYETAEYYTAYVCGELYKDGVYQVRACQSGIITATIYTQYTGTSSTGSVLSDHYVDMKYFDDEQQSYVDYSGYRFLPGYSYPGDWFFYPSGIFGYFPVSIHLGSTTAVRPRITITNNEFNPTDVTPDGIEAHNTSTGSADVGADPPCPSEECLRAGDFVVVVLVKNTAGGNFTYKIGDTNDPAQTQLVRLTLGDGVRASWKVTAVAGMTPRNVSYSFTIRVSDVRRPNDPNPNTPLDLSTSTSLLSPTGVILHPTNGGEAKNLHVN